MSNCTLEFTANAQAHMSPLQQAAVRRVASFLYDTAKAAGLETAELRVSWFVDPEEGTSYPVITHRVACGADVAFHYWHNGAEQLAKFISTLLDDERKAAEEIAVDLDWTDKATTKKLDFTRLTQGWPYVRLLLIPLVAITPVSILLGHANAPWWYGGVAGVAIEAVVWLTAFVCQVAWRDP